MCQAKSDVKASKDEPVGTPWPENRKTTGLGRLGVEFDKWTYSYMNELLYAKKDESTKLTQEDLFRVSESMETQTLVRRFDARYAELEGQKKRLTKTLWTIATPTFVPAGFCQLGTVICQVAMPLLVRELLRILEDNPDEKIIREGLPYSIGIFLSLVINAFCNHRHRHLATKAGVVLRSAMVGIIYERVLRLTPAGRQGVTNGEVTTLVAIDTQKLFEVTQEAHLAWSMPLSVILVTIFLLLIMGPTTLVGLAVLMLFVPVVERVATKMLSVRRERVKMTDLRVEIISAMLQGIKVTKLNNYEENYKARITHVREEEHKLLRAELAWWAVTLCITVISPMFAAAGTFTTYVLSDSNNVLTSSETFAVLLLFIALRFPISYTGRLIGRAAQALESIRRISVFLEREVREAPKIPEAEMETASDSSVESGSILEVKNAEFYVSDQPSDGDSETETAPGFTVSGLDFSISRGETLAIAGPVGSGKSIALNGLMKEVTASGATSIATRGKMAYVSQTAFIINATLRSNITFGLEYEPDWYGKVLDACCLRQDLIQLGAAGDLTEIGERGVTLSGGQKQRVNLARAVYARPDLICCDDILSALDAGTAKQIFNNLIKPMDKEKSLLSDAAIILVTHASYYLNRVDKIILMHSGSACFSGTWNELLTFEPDDANTKDAVDFIRSSVQEGSTDNNDGASSDQNGEDKASGAENEETGKLIKVEEREHGLSQLSTWLLWFKYAGGLPFLSIQFIFLFFDRLMYVASEWWLARWTSASSQSIDILGRTFPSQEDGISAQYDYLTVYAIIIAVGMVFTLLRSEWAVTGGARCAKVVFNAMLARILLAPVPYFDSTPLGRILSRMSYDTEVIDISLTEAMSVLMIATSWFVAGVTIMVTILPWIALAIIPALIIYIMTLTVYRKSGTDLQRLDAVARSPIQALVSEALEGSTTIRSFGQTLGFIQNFYSSTDKSSAALLNFISAQRWMGIRIELIGSVIVLIACLLVISLNDTLGLEPGLVALLVIWSVNFTITLGFLVDYFAEGEAAITSIERCDAMTRIPQEKSMKTDPSVSLALSWPESGRLEFKEVDFRYRAGLPLALNKLSFTIPAGKRCGVVGRTGAGKSSLTVALFRLIEIESGQILLDGVDISTLGLSDVRGRTNGIAIIPQDPFIAGTTIRNCLDPFGHANDNQILEALEAVRLSSTTVKSYGLEEPVAEGGQNFSVGERQLLNLARAFLSKPKVLVLDEATASIDGETDAFIQQMIRDRFQNTTLITVAHRLNTIIDYDMILCLDAGRVVESGSPKDLLDDKTSNFSQLVDATGAESARALRSIAGATQ